MAAALFAAPWPTMYLSSSATICLGVIACMDLLPRPGTLAEAPAEGNCSTLWALGGAHIASLVAARAPHSVADRSPAAETVRSASGSEEDRPEDPFSMKQPRPRAGLAALLLGL